MSGIHHQLCLSYKALHWQLWLVAAAYNLLLMATKEILVFFKSDANGLSIAGQTACIALSPGFALFPLVFFYLTYSLCKDG